jgi:glutathione synthase/RimK-type ligase-like ATP-grasp enzyme
VLDGVPLGRPAAVYLRGLYISPLAFMVDAGAAMDANWRRTMVAFREKGELLLALVKRWEALGIPIYNPPGASDATRKPFQIAHLAAAGLPVPETLWTNDPDAVRRFAAGRRVVFKPVSGGAATRELRDEDLVPERLARLAAAPVTFQELLPGEDLRLFVLDGRLVAAYRIVTGALDYRQNEDAIEAFAAPPELERLALVAAGALGLRFTGIDFKLGSDGRPRLLECNPSPMFRGFDQRAGTDLLGALADALASHSGKE